MPWKYCQYPPLYKFSLIDHQSGHWRVTFNATQGRRPLRATWVLREGGWRGGKELYLFDFIRPVLMQRAPRTAPQNNQPGFHKAISTPPCLMQPLHTLTVCIKWVLLKAVHVSFRLSAFMNQFLPIKEALTLKLFQWKCIM